METAFSGMFRFVSKAAGQNIMPQWDIQSLDGEDTVVNWT
jgi:hypothetical protein